jgi:hypothetical protein
LAHNFLKKKKLWHTTIHPICSYSRKEDNRASNAHLSLTLEQGSMDSSLAATDPSVTLLRYTSGVFPINCAPRRFGFYSPQPRGGNKYSKRTAKERAIAHLGDNISDRRRWLSHCVSKLKNQRKKFYPGPVSQTKWPEQREKTDRFGAEILGSWCSRLTELESCKMRIFYCRWAPH